MMEVSKIQALQDRVLLKIEKESNKTPGGLIIPLSNRTKTEIAVVVNVGRLIEQDENVEIKVGNRVVYDKYAGILMNIKDEEYLIVKIDDIFAKINE